MERLSFNLCPFREIYSRFSLGRVERVLTSTQTCKQNNVSQNWKRSVLIPVLKDNVKECSNCCTIAHISHASNVMLKILQAWLQQYVNWKLQMYKLDLEKAEVPEIKLPDHRKSKGIPEKKKIYFFFSVYTNAFDCVDHNNLWKNS